jgi:hypothetical protein
MNRSAYLFFQPPQELAGQVRVPVCGHDLMALPPDATKRACFVGVSRSERLYFWKACPFGNIRRRLDGRKAPKSLASQQFGFANLSGLTLSRSLLMESVVGARLMAKSAAVDHTGGWQRD